jgi:hypothetical protein
MLAWRRIAPRTHAGRSKSTTRRRCCCCHAAGGCRSSLAVIVVGRHWSSWSVEVGGRHGQTWWWSVVVSRGGGSVVVGRSSLSVAVVGQYGCDRHAPGRGRCRPPPPPPGPLFRGPDFNGAMQDSILVDAMKSGLLMGAFRTPSSFTSRRVTPVVSPSLSGEAMTPS